MSTTNFEKYRRDQLDREQAQRRTNQDILNVISVVRTHLEDRNYGLADEALESLENNLSPDVDSPMFDRNLVQVRADQLARERTRLIEENRARGKQETLS